MSRRAHAIAAVGVATASFGMAMTLRDVANPWWTNVLAAGAAALVSVFVLRDRLHQLFDTTAREALAAIAIGLLLVAATHATYALGAPLIPELGVSVARLYDGIQSRMPPLFLTIPLVFAVVLAEELVWRGVTVELLRPLLSARSTILIATALYSVPQVFGRAWLLVLAALVLGVILSIQRIATKSLAAPLITHTIWSISIFVLFPLE